MKELNHKMTKGYISLEKEGVPHPIQLSFDDKKGIDTARAVLRVFSPKFDYICLNKKL
jgi:hypothetical protein